MKRRPKFSRIGRLITTTFVIVLMALFGAPEARAETLVVVASSPADGDALAVSPPSISVTFNLALGSAVTMIVNCNGAQMAVPSARTSADQFSIVLDLSTTPLPAGNCGVEWSAQALGGSIQSGKLAFKIAQSTVTATTTTQTTVAPQSTAPAVPAVIVDPAAMKGPLVLARLFSSFGLAVLFGALVLIAVAWPEGVEYVVTIRFLRSAWIVALAGTVAVVACLTAQMSGKSFSASLSPTSWKDLSDTIPGKAALARLLFCAAAGWVAIRPERAIDPTTQLPALALPGLAVVTLGISRTGGDLELVGYVAGAAHVLAMAVWFGGLVLLARVVLSGPGQEDLVHATRGFGRLATPALVITVLTGVVQMYRLDIGYLTNRTHGQVLILKVLAVAGVIFVGVTTRQFIRARLTRVDVLSSALAKRLSRAVGMEALGGALILLLTSWLLALQPGKLADAGNGPSNYAFRKQFIDAKAANDVTVFVTPALVGPNAVFVKLTKPVSAVTAFTVTFSPPADQVVPSVVLTPSLLEAGSASLPLSEGVPLNAPGAWTMTVSILTAQGEFRDSVVFSVLPANGSAAAPTTPSLTLPVVSIASTTTVITVVPTAVTVVGETTVSTVAP